MSKPGISFSAGMGQQHIEIMVEKLQAQVRCGGRAQSP